MKTRRLLYLTAQQMVATRWQAGHLDQEGIFAANESGHQQFAAYLAQHPNDVFVLLANVSEEGFQVETIPFLQGADRQTVIKRRLGQVFFNAPLTAFLSLGREKTSRKDERVLLAALTSQELFAPWLKLIATGAVALSGIYSLPLLAPSLITRLKITERQSLLLTLQDQSIRQSYLEEGHVHFSRLTPLHSLNNDSIAQAFATEAVRLQQYLTSQRILARNQAITARILAHPEATPAIRSHCINTDTLQFVTLDLGECAKKTGLKTLPRDIGGEALFLNLMAVAPPSIQFADDDLRHSHDLTRIRNALYGLGATALLGGLVATATLLYEGYAVNQEAEQLRQEAALATRRYEEIVKTFPPIPTSNETLRRVIDRYVELEKRSTSPNGLYGKISRALQATPTIELDEIDWLTGGTDPGTKPGNAAQPATAAIPADSEAAIVRGAIRLGNNANPRQMLAVFDQFIAALKTNPNLQIAVQKRPFDIEPGKTLKNEDTSVEDRKPRSFSLQITRRIGS